MTDSYSRLQILTEKYEPCEGLDNFGDAYREGGEKEVHRACRQFMREFVNRTLVDALNGGLAVYFTKPSE